MKDVLKYLRQTSGFTQADAASKLGVSRQSYSKYENGTVIPSDALVAKAAELYGVDESFIRANKLPSISASNVKYKIDSEDKILEVASPEYEFTDISQKKSYDAYFDGNTVRVIGEANFYEGQRFKLFPVDDGEKRYAAWEDLQEILSKHNPLVMPSDKDPFYKEMLEKAMEEKHGYFD